MSVDFLALRSFGFCGAVTALLVVVPRASHGAADPLIPFVVTGLLLASALQSLSGQLWSGTAGTLAAISLVMTVATPAAGSSRAAVALAGAAVPLVAPLLAAAVSAQRGWATAGILAGLVAGPIHALVYDPFLDPGCELRCDHSPLAIAHMPVFAGVAQNAGVWIAVAAILAQLHRGRHHLALIACAAGAALVAVRHSPALHLAAIVVVSTLAAELAARARLELRLRELVKALDAGDDLEQTLRSLLRDPGISVAYVVDDDANSQALVDRKGNPSPPPRLGQASTRVRTTAGTVAWIRHRETLQDAPRLTRALNGRARLAFEVERMGALTSVHSRQIIDSRARIIATNEAERHRLERDLHDGAQQFVLALGMQLELALLDVDATSALHTSLEVCMSRARAALDDLRAITRTLRPFPVDIASLATTLHALALRSQVPVTLGPVPERLVGAKVEAAAIAFVQAALSAAASAVDIAITDHGASIEVRLNGQFDATALVGAVDRVAAVGGEATIEADTVTAVLPCES